LSHRIYHLDQKRGLSLFFGPLFSSLVAHRVPPQLLGIVPVNAGGFGSIQDAAEVFHNNEIRPIMAALEGVRHDG
jgi:hypothetical protein|tara:strand:- start:2070 stop:2294 length:225 start_codon:yes stop_codon:yes gene_type:complete